MGNREILDAEPHRDLVVNNAIRARCKNAQKDDLCVLHGERVFTPNEKEISHGRVSWQTW